MMLRWSSRTPRSSSSLSSVSVSSSEGLISSSPASCCDDMTTHKEAGVKRAVSQPIPAAADHMTDKGKKKSMINYGPELLSLTVTSVRVAWVRAPHTFVRSESHQKELQSC